MNYDELKESFITQLQNDKRATDLYNKIQNGTGTYKTAAQYATRIGDDLGKVLKANNFMIHPEEWDIGELIPSTLGLDYELIVDACRTVQNTMNADAGLGIKYQAPDFNMDRALGIVQELTDHADFNDIKASFYDQLVNFSMNVVDDSIRDNAGKLYRAGVRSLVIRQAEFKACEWCRDVAGSFDYNDVMDTGNDVWRRHDNCRCTIDFITERNGSMYRERTGIGYGLRMPQ